MALHHCVGNTISIRAPARGATGIWRVAERFPNISICAPARGATSRSVHTRRRINHFNPRSHEGSDITGMANVRHQKAFQSALPRGERPEAFLKIIFIFLFQSALPRGERPAVQATDLPHAHFNLRSREGSDYIRYGICDRSKHFNPRSHEGSDIIRLAESLGMRISIRAPARGATKSRNTSYPGLDISIRAPARGATVLFPYFVQSLRFQSALPRGERLF